MSSKWLSPFVFKKESQDFSFSQYNQNNIITEYHIYSPWQLETNPELLFQVKKEISENGHCEIELNKLCPYKLEISEETLEKIQYQIEKNIETQLVLSNLESAHLYRIKNINFDRKNPKVIVDDVFILSAHEERGASEVEKTLESFIEGCEKENIFGGHAPRLYKVQQGEARSEYKEFKWSLKRRNLTYDYFIESKELQENVYQDLWKSLTKASQHELIVSGLLYHESLFLAHPDKWQKLEDSFKTFQNAVYVELNDLYIDKLCRAINMSESLMGAWRKYKEQNPTQEFTTILDELVEGERELIKTFNEFSIYIGGIKNFLFYLKQHFSKNLVNEESLYIENFIGAINHIVEPYRLCEIMQLLEIYNKVNCWINEVRGTGDDFSVDATTQRECNLKLSGVLNAISSNDIDQNLILKLGREKSSSHTPKPTLEGQVKSLFNIDLKKAA